MSEQGAEQQLLSLKKLKKLISPRSPQVEVIPSNVDRAEVLNDLFRKIHEYDSHFKIPEAFPLENYKPPEEDVPEGDVRLYHGVVRGGLHGLLNIIVSGFEASVTNTKIRRRGGYAFLSTGLKGSAIYSLDRDDEKKPIGIVLEMEVAKKGLIDAELGAQGADFYGMDIESPDIKSLISYDPTRESTRATLDPCILKALYVVNPPTSLEGKDQATIVKESTIYRISGNQDTFLQVATGLAQQGLTEDDSIKYGPVKK